MKLASGVLYSSQVEEKYISDLLRILVIGDSTPPLTCSSAVQLSIEVLIFSSQIDETSERPRDDIIFYISTRIIECSQSPILNTNKSYLSYSLTCRE